jgi:predicted transcriptional regulator
LAKNHSDKTVKEMSRTEDEARTIEELSARLRKMERRLEEISSRQSSKSSIDAEHIQRIVTKISALRDLIDKAEVEMHQLDSRIGDIESLRFKRRTQE